MRLLRTASLASIVFSMTCLQLSTSEFCLVKTLETKPVRRSYLAQVKIPKTYTCCPNLSCDPPICTKYETVMEKKWKVEMVTARVFRKKVTAASRSVLGSVSMGHALLHTNVPAVQATE